MVRPKETDVTVIRVHLAYLRRIAPMDTDTQLYTALGAVMAPLSPTAADDGYVVEKRGRTSAAGLWLLTYPDGSWQRTRTRRDAQRLADLHRSDRAAWTLEVAGSGATVDGTRP